MRADGLRDVTESIDSCTPNGFFVSLQQLQKLETYPHPFPSRDKLRPSVSYSPYQVNAVLLDLLMPEKGARSNDKTASYGAK